MSFNAQRSVCNVSPLHFRNGFQQFRAPGKFVGDFNPKDSVLLMPTTGLLLRFGWMVFCCFLRWLVAKGDDGLVSRSIILFMIYIDIHYGIQYFHDLPFYIRLFAVTKWRDDSYPAMVPDHR